MNIFFPVTQFLHLLHIYVPPHLPLLNYAGFTSGLASFTS